MNGKSENNFHKEHLTFIYRHIRKTGNEYKYY